MKINELRCFHAEIHSLFGEQRIAELHNRDKAIVDKS